MSLKAFHVIFVTICLILAVAFGFWALREYRADPTAQSLYFCLGSFLCAVVLAIYGAWFLKKLKNVSYI